MLEKQKKIKVSSEQLAVIEAALHTQSKILDVQAEAGGAAARLRRNEIKRLLAQLSQQKPVEPKATRNCATGWFGMRRIFD
tara:strand:- start:409 stop:651 length:243 start_codon:yes stop_codon:yes gene_type:complete